MNKYDFLSIEKVKKKDLLLIVKCSEFIHLKFDEEGISFYIFSSYDSLNHLDLNDSDNLSDALDDDSISYFFIEGDSVVLSDQLVEDINDLLVDEEYNYEIDTSNAEPHFDIEHHTLTIEIEKIED